jgi:ribosome biogenesis GTPase A
MVIQWYPGHMAKTKRLIKESLKLVDIVVEVLDARVPMSSRNPEIDDITNNKPRIVVLNKSDMADENINKLWMKYFEEKGFRVILLDSIKGKNIKQITDCARDIMKEKMELLAAKGRIKKNIRLMIIGIPNVGKSTIINKMSKKAIAQTADRPGVTKSNRWIKVDEDIDMCDTPGILWPKFEDQRVGKNLAFVGSIKDEILNSEELAYFLIKELQEKYPKNIYERFKLEDKIEESEIQQMPTEDLIEVIARKRGCIMSGSRINVDRISIQILDDFRGVKLGRISLEVPSDYYEG